MSPDDDATPTAYQRAMALFGPRPSSLRTPSTSKPPPSSMTNVPDGSSRGPSTPGPSCATCRMKKRGCDRMKPACTQCASRKQDCVYRLDAPVRKRDSMISLSHSQGTTCSMCRLKKRACDRGKPVCGQCDNRGQSGQCSYRPEDMPSRKKKVRRPTESTIATPQVVIEPPSSMQLSAWSQVDDEPDPEPSEVASVRSDQSFHTAVWPWPQETAAPPPVDSPEWRRLQLAIDGQADNVKNEGTEKDELTLAGDIPSTTEEEEPSTEQHNETVSVPQLPQEMMDRLMHTYITREYVNLPIFDLLVFQPAYKNAVSKGLSSVPKPFQAVLYTIFGLSGLRTSDLDDTLVTRLFNYGHQLAKDTEFNGNIVQRVQIYLLQSQYFHATRRPKLAWASLGYAIRTIDILGLKSKTGHDPRQRGTRERVCRLWHSAAIMERILALQIGLSPETKHPLSMALPNHLDGDYLDTISGGEPSVSGDRPSLVGFLAACARLYSHVEDIMAWEGEVRLRPGACAQKKLLTLDFQPFLRADGLLHDWQSSLPTCLHHSTAGDLWEDPIVHYQRNILRVRSLYLRLRLYRPLMMLGLALGTECNCRPGNRPHTTGDELSSPDSPVTWSLVRDASNRCITTVSEILNILDSNDDGLLDGGPHDIHRNHIPPYWENVDYLYACGTVLLAARLCPFLRRRGHNAQGTNTNPERCWTRVLVLLKRYQNMRPEGRMKEVAQQCRLSLRNLSEKISKPNTATASTATLPAAINGTSAAPAVLDDEEDGDGRPSPAGQRQAATELPAPSHPAKRRRLGSELGQRSFEWVESGPRDLAGEAE